MSSIAPEGSTGVAASSAAVAAVPAVPRIKGLWREIKANRMSYLFLAPFLILFLTFTVLPVILSIVLSFTYFNMLNFPRWVGWENY